MTSLDWRDHATGRGARCRVCNEHTILRDEGGRPCHKVCAELEVDPSAPRTTRAEIDVPPATATCMHAECDRPATVLLRAKYDRRPWPACGKHKGAMSDALYRGQPTDGGAVHTTTIKGKR